MKPQPAKFKVGEAVCVTIGKTPVYGKIVKLANRTGYDPRQNYKVEIEGTVKTYNEHWLLQA